MNQKDIKKWNNIAKIVSERVSKTNEDFDDNVKSYIKLCTNALISSDLTNLDSTIAYRSVVYSAYEFQNMFSSWNIIENYYSTNWHSLSAKNVAGRRKEERIRNDFINDLVADCVEIRKRIFQQENRKYSVIKLEKDEEMEGDYDY